MIWNVIFHIKLQPSSVCFSLPWLPTYFPFFSATPFTFSTHVESGMWGKAPLGHVYFCCLGRIIYI